MLYLKRDHLTEWFNGKQNERRHGSASPFTVLKTNCIDDRVYASALDSGLAPLPWASCNNCMLVRLLLALRREHLSSRAQARSSVATVTHTDGPSNLGFRIHKLINSLRC